MRQGAAARASLRRQVAAIAAVALVVAVALAVWAQRDRLVAGGLFGGVAAQIDASAHQAVFLTGGQVYFGRLVARGDVYLLTDVYYLSSPSDDDPLGTLIKRGNEVHGPREPMIILASQVLLIENQRADSEVMKAIERFRRGESPAVTPPPLGPTPRPSPTRP